MSGDAPELSIVVPVYNEEEAVAGVISNIADSGISASHEIVVVDDASSDGTGRILEKLAEEGAIRLVGHEHNRGYGAALKTGISAARSEKVIIIDGDGSYPTGHFDEFLELSEEYDMVVGARTTGVKEEPFLRTLVKGIIIRLLKILAEIDVPDLNSGLRLMKKSQVTRWFHLLPDGLSFTSTITLILLSEAKPVKYVPVDYFARKGASKFSPVRDTMGILILIFRTMLYFNPLKVFLPVAIGLVLLAGVVAVASIFAGKFMDVTTVVILLTAVQIFVLGLLADLIAKRRQ